MDEPKTRIYETKHLYNVRLYVIGAVTGIENDNREAFEQARTELKRAGYKVEIPHDTIPAGTPWKQAMHQSIRRLLESDGVAVLDGFAESAGASIEYALCCDLKHPVGNWRRWVEDATRHISYTVPESLINANPMLGIVTESKPTANRAETQ